MRTPGITQGCARKILKPIVTAITLILGYLPTSAADIRVFSGGAPQQVLRVLAPEFEKQTGHRVEFTFALITAIQQKLAAGEKADLLLLPTPLIGATERTIALRAEGRIAVARVGIGVIVPEGTPLPDISTSEAVRKTLLDAKSVAFPEPSTPSGAHLARLGSWALLIFYGQN